MELAGDRPLYGHRARTINGSDPNPRSQADEPRAYRIGGCSSGRNPHLDLSTARGHVAD